MTVEKKGCSIFAAALLDMDFAYRRKAGKSLQQESRRLGPSAGCLHSLFQALQTGFEHPFWTGQV